MGTELLARLILSGIIVLGFGGVVSAYIIWPPPERSELLTVLLTSLGLGYTTVILYWFTREGPKP